MTIKLLTEHHFEFLILKGGCTCLSESINVKMPYCWKSQDAAHICVAFIYLVPTLVYVIKLNYIIQHTLAGLDTHVRKCMDTLMHRLIQTLT